jgi:6-bladed beta-propeller
MRIFNLRKSCFLPIILLCILVQNSYAQDAIVEKGEVVFVSSWPNKEMMEAKKSFFKYLNDIVFGSNDLKLTKPVALLKDSISNYWILDQESKTIFEGNNKEYKSPKFIDKGKNDLASLVSITNFTDGKMLVCDSYLNKIFVVDPAKKTFYSLNDSLKLLRPTGIVYSPTSNLIWVVETGKHQILVLNTKGEISKVIGKRGNGEGDFNFPASMAIDKTGNVYVVDAMNFRVQIFNKEGEFQSMFGSNGDGTGSFASPKGIAIDSYGHIYIADALFHAVQIFNTNGDFLYAFGTQGRGEGEFWMPSGIFIDKFDHIYVADTYNSRIQEFKLKIEGKK